MDKRDFIKSGLLGLGCLGLGLARQSALAQTYKGVRHMETSALAKKPHKEVYFYSREGNNVVCETCPNYCTIKPGKKGSCRTKINLDGKLYTLAYGNPCAVHVDPIEKKPLLHYLPGTKAFSIATAGCVLSCLNCQNWDISQASPEDTINQVLMPEEVVAECLKKGCTSIAYTYSEPIAWYEYAYDTARLAHEKGIRNLLISCGYINDKPLRQLAPYIHAANINLKSFSDDIYRKLNGGQLEPILNTLKVLKENKVWLEITNLIVPNWTDDFTMIGEMCGWLVTHGFSDNPLHFNRFFPQHKLTRLPATPEATLLKAREIALKKGMKYVYVGNIPGNSYEDTYCPKCGKIVVNRSGFKISQMDLVKGKCRHCASPVAGVWE